MEITVEQLLAFIADQDAVPVALSNRNSRVWGARLFNERTHFESGILYVGYGSRLRRTDSLGRGVNLMCIGQLDDQSLPDDLSGSNIIALPAESSLEDVFNRVQALFDSGAQQANPLHIDGLSSALVGKGLQNALDVGQAILSNPVYLVHDEYILVAKSTRIAVPDIVCQELQLKGRLTMNEADEYFGERFLQRFRTFSKPVLIKSPKLPYDRILGKVDLPGGEDVAVAVVEYSRAFQDQDFETVEVLCSAIEQELSGGGRSRSINEAKLATVVNDLIGGSIRDEKHLRRRLESIDWESPDSFKLYLTSAPMVSDTYLTFYRDLFSQQLPQADVFIHDDMVIVLQGVTSGKQSTRDLEERIAYLCEINNLRCAASDGMRSLSELATAFRQASHVLQTVARLKMPEAFFRYEDFMLLFLVERLEYDGQLESFVHPIVRAVQEHDQENGSDYMNTLYSYLLHAKDMVGASQTLFVHRNTLAYRLRRLAEMFDIDWDDGYLLVQLFISLEILRHASR